MTPKQSSKPLNINTNEVLANNANQTSNHFLGSIPRTWMTTAGSTSNVASIQPEWQRPVPTLAGARVQVPRATRNPRTSLVTNSDPGHTILESNTQSTRDSHAARGQETSRAEPQSGSHDNTTRTADVSSTDKHNASQAYISEAASGGPHSPPKVLRVTEDAPSSDTRPIQAESPRAGPERNNEPVPDKPTVQQTMTSEGPDLRDFTPSAGIISPSGDEYPRWKPHSTIADIPSPASSEVQVGDHHPAKKVRLDGTASQQSHPGPLIPLPHSQPSRSHSSDTSTALDFVKYFDSGVADLSRTVTLNVSAQARILWIRQACSKNDLVFLLLHQLLCLWTVKPHWTLVTFNLTEQHIQGLTALGRAGLNNSTLPEALVTLMSDFLTPQSTLEAGVVHKMWVDQVKHFLDGFEHRFLNLKSACISRSYPSSAGELAFHLRCSSSPVLRQITFLWLAQPFLSDPSTQLRAAILALFETSQVVFASKLEETNLSRLPEDWIDQDARQFGGRFSMLAQKYKSRQNIVSNPVSLDSVVFFRPLTGDAVTAANPLAQRAMATRPVTHQMSPSLSGQPSSPQSRGILRPNPVSTQFPSPVSVQESPHVTTTAVQAVSLPNQENTTAPLLPPETQRLLIAANPNPTEVALHQAHLRSPSMRHAKPANAAGTNHRMYAYFEHFILEPQVFDHKCQYANWSFDLSSALYARLAHDVTVEDDIYLVRDFRQIRNHSVCVNLRCVELPKDSIGRRDEEWPVLRTHWPDCCFYTINQEFIEVRRKVQHGKDLVADITRMVKEGKNTLELSYYPSHIEQRDKTKYAVAVEMINVLDHESVSQLRMSIPAEHTLDSIKAALNNHASNDGNDGNEIAILSDHISIDLADPFTSRIFDIPVRGKSCSHRECFDLTAFLLSRKCRNKDDLVKSDEWLCPLCKRDARPNVLVLDEFLADVKRSLVQQQRQQQQGRRDVKAILVKADGSWEVKADISTDINNNNKNKRSPARRNVRDRHNKSSTADSDISSLDNSSLDNASDARRASKHISPPDVVVIELD